MDQHDHSFKKNNKNKLFIIERRLRKEGKMRITPHDIPNGYRKEIQLGTI